MGDSWLPESDDERGAAIDVFNNAQNGCDENGEPFGWGDEEEDYDD